MGQATKPRRPDDGLTGVVGLVTEVRLTRVDRHPHLDRLIGRPRLRGQSDLGVDRSLERIGRPGERGDDRVALALFEGWYTAVSFDGFVQDLVVTDDRGPHRDLVLTRPHTCRTGDIGE